MAILPNPVGDVLGRVDGTIATVDELLGRVDGTLGEVGETLAGVESLLRELRQELELLRQVPDLAAKLDEIHAIVSGERR